MKLERVVSCVLGLLLMLSSVSAPVIFATADENGEIENGQQEEQYTGPQETRGGGFAD